MTCKSCGAEIADGAKFCENCGNKIEEAVNETVNETVEEKEPERVEAEIVYAPMVAEAHEYQYNADAFEARGGVDMNVEAQKEVSMVRTDKAR